MTEYKFKYLANAMDFIKPLVVEGDYKLTITTKYKEYPRESSIDYISVIVEKIKE